MHCVVGSGPAGVACAQALLKKGVAVQMVDVGITLPTSRAEIVQQLRSLPPSSWDPRQVRLLKENMVPDGKGIPQKVVFGSDFDYTSFLCREPNSFGSMP